MANPFPFNTFCWNELATSDTSRCVSFYTQLFDWTAQTGDIGGVSYTIFKKGGADICGMIQMTPEWGEMKPHWMSYVAVEDVDAAAQRVTELGGTVCVPPTDIPVGRFALVTDPVGAVFSLIRLTPEPGPEKDS